LRCGYPLFVLHGNTQHPNTPTILTHCLPAMQPWPRRSPSSSTAIRASTTPSLAQSGFPPAPGMSPQFAFAQSNPAHRACRQVCRLWVSPARHSCSPDLPPHPWQARAAHRGAKWLADFVFLANEHEFAKVEKPSAIKCATFGASSLATRHLATGDFAGHMMVW
jgi:hypothetical protein